MKSQLALILNEYLSRVAHELTASVFNVTRKSGSEHHHLLVVGSFTENLLDVGAEA